MDLKQLRSFVQVVASGSFSAASGRLNTAQPALSRQVRALEDELGVVLLHRTGRGVLPTAAGQALLADATQLLDAADALRRRVRGFAHSPAGNATIGLSPTVGRSLALPLAARVRADFPRLRLRVAEAFSGTLLEWLGDGRIDAAILYHEPAHAAIRAETVAEESLALIGGVGERRFAPGAPVPLVAVANCPLVLSTPDHGLRRMIERYASEAGVTLDVAYEFDSLDATIALVRKRQALTILPEAAVAAELAAGALVAWPIVEPELTRPLVVATAPQRRDAAAPRDLAQLLREVIAAVAGDGRWRLRR